MIASLIERRGNISVSFIPTNVTHSYTVGGIAGLSVEMSGTCTGNIQPGINYCLQPMTITSVDLVGYQKEINGLSVKKGEVSKNLYEYYIVLKSGVVADQGFRVADSVEDLKLGCGFYSFLERKHLGLNDVNFVANLIGQVVVKVD